MVHTQVFHTEWCETVDCFLKKIDASGINQTGSTWLFRGQKRDWPLLPASMRFPFVRKYVVPVYHRLKRGQESRTKTRLSAAEKLNLKLYVQRRVEDLTVTRFAQVADRAHLHIPSDSNFELGGEAFKIDSAEIDAAVRGKPKPIRPPTSVVDALAQHHRVPTRLLDWTYNPYVAAYFAAELEAKDKRKALQEPYAPMVVWAVNYTTLEIEASDLALVVQPRTQIGNLLAQDGAFLYDKNADQDFRKKKRWVSFEQKLPPSYIADAYYKYEMPVEIHDELRNRMRQFGIWEPGLMPSFDTAAKWTLEHYGKHPMRLYWQPPRSQT